MQMQDFFGSVINLRSTPTTAVKYTIPVLLVDHGDVPVDVRVRQITPATMATRMTAGSTQLAWFTQFYGQNYPTNPANARKNIPGYLARWVSAAIAAYRVFPNAETSATVWAGLTNTSGFKLADGTNTEAFTPNFTGDTDIADVAASITAAFAAGTNFTGYVCSVDNLNRLIITGDTVGTASKSFTLVAPDSGVNLLGADYLAYSSSFLQPGLAAETLAAATAATFVKDNTPTVCFQRGATDEQKLAWVTAMDAFDDKFTVVTSSDVNHEDSEETTTLGLQMEALGLDKAYCIYSRQTDYIDAAAFGENLPQKEGSVDYALNPLANVYQSGMELDGVTPAEVSDAAVEALDAAKTDFVTKPYNVWHLARGLCPSGDEVRVVLCRQWAQYNISREGYLFMVENKVNTFSDSFLMALKGIFEKYLDECVARRCLEPGYTITMPAAADFTAAEKASHTMSLTDVASAGIQFAVNYVIATMTWQAQ